jgi:hypothetical protein
MLGKVHRRESGDRIEASISASASYGATHTTDGIDLLQQAA